MAFSLGKRERERERERVNLRPLGIKQHFPHKNTTKHENQNSSETQILLHKTQNSSKIQILPIPKTDKTPKIPTPKPPPQGRGLSKGQILSHKTQNSSEIQLLSQKIHKIFHKALNFTQISKKFTQITHCKRFA